MFLNVSSVMIEEMEKKVFDVDMSSDEEPQQTQKVFNVDESSDE